MDKVLNQADMKPERTEVQVTDRQNEPVTKVTTEPVPAFVTEVRKGNKIITARGFFNPAAKESAVEKMERVIRIAGEASGY